MLSSSRVVLPESYYFYNLHGTARYCLNEFGFHKGRLMIETVRQVNQIEASNKVRDDGYHSGQFILMM